MRSNRALRRSFSARSRKSSSARSSCSSHLRLRQTRILSRRHLAIQFLLRRLFRGDFRAAFRRRLAASDCPAPRRARLPRSSSIRTALAPSTNASSAADVSIRDATSPSSSRGSPSSRRRRPRREVRRGVAFVPGAVAPPGFPPRELRAAEFAAVSRTSLRLPARPAPRNWRRSTRGVCDAARLLCLCGATRIRDPVARRRPADLRRRGSAPWAAPTAGTPAWERACSSPSRTHPSSGARHRVSSASSPRTPRSANRRRRVAPGSPPSPTPPADADTGPSRPHGSSRGVSVRIVTIGRVIVVRLRGASVHAGSVRYNRAFNASTSRASAASSWKSSIAVCG